MKVQKNKIEVSKEGAGKTMYIPLSVYRAGKQGLTISLGAANPDHRFKFGTSPEQLQKFRDKLEHLFTQLVKRQA